MPTIRKNILDTLSLDLMRIQSANGYINSMKFVKSDVLLPSEISIYPSAGFIVNSDEQIGYATEDLKIEIRKLGITIAIYLNNKSENKSDAIENMIGDLNNLFKDGDSIIPIYQSQINQLNGVWSDGKNRCLNVEKINQINDEGIIIYQISVLYQTEYEGNANGENNELPIIPNILNEYSIISHTHTLIPNALTVSGGFIAGTNCVTTGNYPVAFGNSSTSSSYAVSCGYQTKASGGYSFASGYQTQATNSYSFTSGYQTQATNLYSFATGRNTLANGVGSFALGTNSVASNSYAIAGGNGCVATNIGSVALGYQSVGAGWWAFTHGYKTQTLGEHQFVIGKSNIINNTDLFIIGNGTDVTRSNILTVAPTYVEINGSLNINNGSLVAPYIECYNTLSFDNNSFMRITGLDDTTKLSIITSDEKGILINSDTKLELTSNSTSADGITINPVNSNVKIFNTIKGEVQNVPMLQIDDVDNGSSFELGDSGDIDTFIYFGTNKFRIRYDTQNEMLIAEYYSGGNWVLGTKLAEII